MTTYGPSQGEKKRRKKEEKKRVEKKRVEKKRVEKKRGGMKGERVLVNICRIGQHATTKIYKYRSIKKKYVP